MPTTLDVKTLSQRLSKRLATFNLGDEVINRVAAAVMIDGISLKRFDVCTYGICVDYFTDRIPRLDDFFSRGNIAHVEVFPYGIINLDHFHVRVGFAIDELQGRGPTH